MFGNWIIDILVCTFLGSFSFIDLIRLIFIYIIWWFLCRYHDTIECYDPESDSWEIIAEMQSSRSWLSCVSMVIRKEIINKERSTPFCNVWSWLFCKEPLIMSTFMPVHLCKSLLHRILFKEVSFFSYMLYSSYILMKICDLLHSAYS